MLNGLVQIKDWESRPKQLAQTHELFESLETFVVTRAESYPWTGRDMNNGAVTHYMRILGNARLYDKMFEVFHGLPPIGPLSPGAHEYSSLFTCLIERPPTEDQTSAEARMKNAADARFLWESVVRRSERVDVDATLLHQVIRALSFGKRAEHALVFDIIHDYLGLEKPQPRVKADTPSDTSPHKPDLGFGGARTQTNEDAVIERKPPRQLVEFSSPLLQWVLEFCNYTRHYELCAQWLRVVMKRDHEGDWQIPDSGHIQQGLLAYAGAALRASHEGAPGNGEPRKVVRLLEEVTREIAYHPSKARALELSGSAFEVAMATCTFGKDWSSATKVFELMAGYDLAVFADGRDHTPQKLPRSGYFQLNPDTITMGYLARLAIELKDASIQRQCVRAVLALGGARLLEYTPYDKAHDKYAPFYKQKMAQAVIKLADTTDRVGLALDVETQHRWKLLASAADKVLRHTREFDDVPVPPVERRSVPELSSAARYKKSRGAGRR
ncbi:hypothetical protein EUX98_g580 [Antrodiella citrinella]|uniref:Uncharacterized protein n=1 Tax=Antrodiella citrinella TaxID=2447956 RepID=A0A4S4N3V1_9APHY|nr:hypothetical protein EUX98_g580 [Antrodiella citrinella]